ncbi:MAG: biotin/lipoyl-containing protein [Anaerovoracaceae bacterium]|jgi:biotin carboxyl carrier protein
MKKYRVLVNGNEYEVQVEELETRENPAVKEQAQPQPEQLPSKDEAPSHQPSGGAIRVEASLPGKVLEIEVSPGEQVAHGQTLLILEAMKMENEIVAPCAGIVETIGVQVGMTVDAGDFLLSLK